MKVILSLLLVVVASCERSYHGRQAHRVSHHYPNIPQRRHQTKYNSPPSNRQAVYKDSHDDHRNIPFSLKDSHDDHKFSQTLYKDPHDDPEYGQAVFKDSHDDHKNIHSLKDSHDNHQYGQAVYKDSHDTQNY